jgi:hypothetical protein
MALAAEPQWAGELSHNVPPFLLIINCAHPAKSSCTMRPVLLRTIQEEVRKNMTAELPTGKEGRRNGVRLRRCDEKDTSKGVGLDDLLIPMISPPCARATGLGKLHPKPDPSCERLLSQ